MKKQKIPNFFSQINRQDNFLFLKKEKINLCIRVEFLIHFYHLFVSESATLLFIMDGLKKLF